MLNLADGQKAIHLIGGINESIAHWYNLCAIIFY